MISDFRNQFGEDESSFILWSLITLSILAFLAYAANLAFYPGNLMDFGMNASVASPNVITENYTPNR